MLRSEHSIVRYDYQRYTVEPDRLIRGRDRDYLSAVAVLLRLYRQLVGKPRQVIHREVETVLSRLPGCPPRRIAAFCKLLDDLGEYHTDKRAAVKLRQRVFSLAAPWHPIVAQREGIFERTVEDARTQISQELGQSWEAIESQLFSDVIELQPLISFPESVEPAEFLATYNVAQTQAALYRATQVRIDAAADFKTIVQQIKLAGLMHRITRPIALNGGYRFDLDGPQTAIRETTRYGVRFAKMLPKLLTCEAWRLTAVVWGPRRNRFQLRLSSNDGLRSPLEPSAAFDSDLEREIFAHWHSAPVTGWTMKRESELLCDGQTILTPDFVLQQDKTGDTIYVEVVGYWTPEYLDEKYKRLKQFPGSGDTRWLLMFPKAQATTKQPALADLPIPIIIFDKRRPPSEWIVATKRVAATGSGSAAPEQPGGGTAGTGD